MPGRLELVDAPGPVLGVVDYAHKPDAIVAALAALREVGHGQLICVIGAGGDRDRGKRPFMGEAAAQGADVVVVTDDNPRTEEPAAIRAEVRRGAEAAGARRVIEVAGRREAIAEAVRVAQPGDVIARPGQGPRTRTGGGRRHVTRSTTASSLPGRSATGSLRSAHDPNRDRVGLSVP